MSTLRLREVKSLLTDYTRALIKIKALMKRESMELCLNPFMFTEKGVVKCLLNA